MHRSALHAARLDKCYERVFRIRTRAQGDVVDPRIVRPAGANAPFGLETETRRGQTERFEQRPLRHVTGVSIKIVNDILACIVTVDGDTIVSDDLEAPGLGIVATGRPAGKIENIEQLVRTHLGLTELSRQACRASRAVSSE